jgi:hypothetical protein
MDSFYRVVPPFSPLVPPMGTGTSATPALLLRILHDAKHLSGDPFYAQSIFRYFSNSSQNRNNRSIREIGGKIYGTERYVS